MHRHWTCVELHARPVYQPRVSNRQGLRQSAAPKVTYRTMHMNPYASRLYTAKNLWEALLRACRNGNKRPCIPSRSG